MVPFLSSIETVSLFNFIKNLRKKSRYEIKQRRVGNKETLKISNQITLNRRKREISSRNHTWRASWREKKDEEEKARALRRARNSNGKEARAGGRKEEKLGIYVFTKLKDSVFNTDGLLFIWMFGYTPIGFIFTKNAHLNFFIQQKQPQWN